MTKKLLLDTLDDFASKNSVADLWLRDDDATQPSPALDRLLGLSARYAVPMTLAVIPEPTGDALAKRLETTSGIDVAVHGWAHRNHARPEEKKRELGLHRPLEIVLDELRTGLTKLQSLHGPRFVPMLVPPWNRIDQTVIEHLPQARYRALSVYGPEKPDSLPLLNTHVDVIDWRGTRGGKNQDLLFAETAERLRQADETGGMTGILTHHLDHDENVWAFLQSLFELTTNHPACRWRSSREWLEQTSP
ncbi:polysaccharide deacetylase family protein [Agrobacterium rubi]|uniref:Polysaccharide deacetylase n=1 Tax=Agrobacterium rubi TaxID=28099 RepID=A0AAE7R7P3_9HYPH|nr:polysaccharide deacetylase family protein [Agrobacterium rubi]NTE87339.1 polysaccharide deacetylase [Agrobacterium rubi]NTF03630.1 polysaccharide deacetylase [Agrobacterium rubi]NTF37789.1 polysaccharide deacetylase [Agrobacterium rubi]OCJ45540.1 polysaccharide deacetylase [Agrobacterium rubi]QTG00051.1 polysaccharide deacetylase [Agrobacterium rubi]